MSERKQILALDFDGVVNSYKSGWQGATELPDPPVDGAIEFITEAVAHFEVHIFSSRCGYSGAIDAMATWLLKHGLTRTILDYIVFSIEKPPALLTIDDRAWCFKGVWPSIQEIKDFKPWHKE